MFCCHCHGNQLTSSAGEQLVSYFTRHLYICDLNNFHILVFFIHSNAEYIAFALRRTRSFMLERREEKCLPERLTSKVPV